MDIRPALQAFLAESHELLRSMEDALLALEKAPVDAEALTEVFRAAHTIKGSAGLFGYEPVVRFTHAVESVLAELRSGNTPIGPDLIALLLSCGDHIAVLLENLAPEDTEPGPALRSAGETLMAQLANFSGGEAQAGMPAAPAAHSGPVEVIAGKAVASDAWHVSVRFGANTLRDGMDPLSIIRYLGTLGTVESVTTVFDAMPEADAMDPETCYLGFELDVAGDLDKETIESAFEFVRDEATLRILPPHSKIADYIALLAGLPEDPRRLGELLVASGALTAHELEEGLRHQSDEAAASPSHQKIGEILVDGGVLPNAVVEAALEKQAVIRERRSTENSFVRVRADKLDELITLVGELVIAGAGTRLLAQRTQEADLLEAATNLERLVEDMRDRALGLRMVPIAETFNRFRRVVRDVGAELGKEIELALDGTDTELDKSMVERIADPLMHLVRNAMDHGIETPLERERAGKRRTGTLRMSAWHDSGSIVIEVADDGRGVSRDRILARAVERGLVAPGEELDDDRVVGLILQAGFSTADRVSDISGRGIGLDVVRSNVEAQRGTVSIASREGAGTTVSMRMPLTLAIIDGFAVGVGPSSYVLPLDAVIECLELSADDRAALRTRGYVNLRGEVLPLLRLRDVFEVEGAPGRRENIVVVQYAGQRAGLVVDGLMGEFQAVIKPLGRLFERLTGIGGSTILGSGEVALILDVPELVQRATASDARREGAGPQPRKISTTASPLGESL